MDYETVERINRNAQYMNTSANKIDREAVHGAKLRGQGVTGEGFYDGSPREYGGSSLVNFTHGSTKANADAKGAS